MPLNIKLGNIPLNETLANAEVALRGVAHVEASREDLSAGATGNITAAAAAHEIRGTFATASPSRSADAPRKTWTVGEILNQQQRFSDEGEDKNINPGFATGIVELNFLLNNPSRAVRNMFLGIEGSDGKQPEPEQIHKHFKDKLVVMGLATIRDIDALYAAASYPKVPQKPTAAAAASLEEIDTLKQRHEAAMGALRKEHEEALQQKDRDQKGVITAKEADIAQQVSQGVSQGILDDRMGKFAKELTMDISIQSLATKGSATSLQLTDIQQVTINNSKDVKSAISKFLADEKACALFTLMFAISDESKKLNFLDKIILKGEIKGEAGSQEIRFEKGAALFLSIMLCVLSEDKKAKKDVFFGQIDSDTPSQRLSGCKEGGVQPESDLQQALYRTVRPSIEIKITHTENSGLFSTGDEKITTLKCVTNVADISGGAQQHAPPPSPTV